MRFVIIGNGVAGTTAAFTLRRREPEAEITMIGGESDYFFSRTALMYAFMDRLSLRDLEPFERQVFARQNIGLLRDWVTGLDAARRTLKLQSGQSVSYDRLLLATGSAPNLPDWAGLGRAREGVVQFVSLQDLENCERLVPSTREAVVVGGGLIGVELVECLAFHRRKVTFLVRSPWYWPGALAREESEIVTEHIRRRGVDLRGGEEVAEVVTGETGRVRAVRTKSGAEFPCQMLGIAIGVRPAVDWLRRVATPPRIERGIVIAPSFQTSLDNVWAAGDCAEFQSDGQWTIEQIWYSAKRQGELAARAMLGDEVRYEPPIFYNSAMFFEIEYTSTGMIGDPPADAVTFFCRIPGKEASIRIVERGGAVVGVNMLGARWNHTAFERWIAERRSMDYVVGHLGEAQFDVEFGRLSLAAIGPRYGEWKQQAVAPR
ncbi:MAG TPA: FAD/NAD(P)-binding oxidoreductase [Candidatus Acidoferrales bacterium]|nr:FAD/NAD(P)-binding oxidoreductase [Candidatus Acidoferrales bacterium]